ncbi:hypothetical protein FGO68_gene10462 [Halteria grandinella]|uniref:Uncharacterized protein n=1 Tax=Halteria grandinella TaxID=5974 RepID=A0A8J8NL99_HALGN|nr:hypothetical protein FGO68_gene10462 [Halteria grandinella]
MSFLIIGSIAAQHGKIIQLANKESCNLKMVEQKTLSSPLNVTKSVTETPIYSNTNETSSVDSGSNSKQILPLIIGSSATVIILMLAAFIIWYFFKAREKQRIQAEQNLATQLQISTFNNAQTEINLYSSQYSHRSGQNSHRSMRASARLYQSNNRMSGSQTRSTNQQRPNQQQILNDVRLEEFEDPIWDDDNTDNRQRANPASLVATLHKTDFESKFSKQRKADGKIFDDQGNRMINRSGIDPASPASFTKQGSYINSARSRQSKFHINRTQKPSQESNLNPSLSVSRAKGIIEPEEDVESNNSRNSRVNNVSLNVSKF